MKREDVKKAAEKIVMDWRNADRPALEKFLPKELAEIINAALEEAAKECERGKITADCIQQESYNDGTEDAMQVLRALKIP